MTTTVIRQASVVRLNAQVKFSRIQLVTAFNPFKKASSLVRLTTTIAINASHGGKKTILLSGIFTVFCFPVSPILLLLSRYNFSTAAFSKLCQLPQCLCSLPGQNSFGNTENFPVHLQCIDRIRFQ